MSEMIGACCLVGPGEGLEQGARDERRREKKRRERRRREKRKGKGNNR